jgi:hypothetical protein
MILGEFSLGSFLFYGYIVLQNANLIGFQANDVARLQENGWLSKDADTGGRTGANNIARLQGDSF